ncbi:MAG: ACT domain-containing protein [Clostridia bacterium]
MKAIISVIGVDKVGIIAKVSNALYEMGINIEDISQTIMQDRVFTMTMMIGDTDDTSMKTLNEKMQSIAKEMNVDIRLQQEDIFLSMHRI